MKKVCLILIGLLAFESIGQETESFSLLSAEEYGVNNNDKMKNVLLDYEAAKKRVWETTAIGLPQISAEGSFQDFIDIPVSVVEASLFNPLAPEGELLEFQMGQRFTTSLTFNVNQLIFDGSYIVGLKFAKFWMEMSNNSIDRTKAEIKTMVREGYYNVLVAQENLSIMDSILLSTEELERENQILLENKIILQEDADQISLTLDRIKMNKQVAERQLEIAKNLLKLQMGYDLDKDIEVTETLDDVLADILANSPITSDNAVTNNVNYQMMLDQQRLDEFALMNEKAAYYPSVGAFLSHSQNAFRNEFNFFNDGQWYPTTVWGIAVSIPITTSGQKVMRVQQAEIKLEQDQNNLNDFERTLEFQELQLKAEFQNAVDQMNFEKQNIALAKFIYEQSLKRKEIGAVSSFDVTQKQNQLLQAEGAYIGSIVQLLNVKIQLDKLYSK